MSFFICTLAASLFYINKPVVDMREHPTHDSKVVSQATFSENITVEKEVDGWAYVVTPDQYTGWLPATSFVEKNEPYAPSLTVSRLAAHLYGINDTEFGPIATLPFGSKLQAIDLSDSRWAKVALPDGKECYIQKGDIAPGQIINSKKDLPAFSLQFIGLPYTWGGRSSFGFDCSGFVQMLYSQLGIKLERDSKQQILDKRFRTVTAEEAEPGDLIFFGKSEQKIVHVGMYIGNGRFIHATVKESQPWIHISNLTDADWSANNETLPYRIFRQWINK